MAPLPRPKAICPDWPAGAPGWEGWGKATSMLTQILDLRSEPEDWSRGLDLDLKVAPARSDARTAGELCNAMLCQLAHLSLSLCIHVCVHICICIFEHSMSI